MPTKTRRTKTSYKAQSRGANPVNYGAIDRGPGVPGGPMPKRVMRGRIGIRGNESHRALAPSSRVRNRLTSRFP